MLQRCRPHSPVVPDRGAATARDDVPPEIACYRHSRSAHLFSMPTNGLSLKPRGRPPPSRLIHSGHGAPQIFFVALPGGGETFFAAFWCALIAPSRVGNVKDDPDDAIWRHMPKIEQIHKHGTGLEPRSG